jgi:hypothetical protein
MAGENTEKLSDATHEADRRDAEVHGHADRMPTPEEERLAESNPQLDPDVIAHEEEMIERGAHQEGEGRID